MEENKINTNPEENKEHIEVQLQENLLPDTSALSYKKNLVRLLILSGLGFLSIILLGISFYLIGIKIF
ncbi:MAG: hypothetical protein JST55_10950 [Bacteroidetes bacterium]|nr:hypothetical protein [Bacteroidota bacterium]